MIKSIKFSTLSLGKPQFEKGRVYLGIAQMRGGLDPCPNGLGHLFWEELFMFKWPNVQLALLCGQICNKCKWSYVIAKFNPSHGVHFWVRCASGNVFTESVPFNLVSWKFCTPPVIFTQCIYLFMRRWCDCGGGRMVRIICNAALSRWNHNTAPRTLCVCMTPQETVKHIIAMKA